jgi:prepilin-type N-terminal cleavage/methylation domain-containing protein
MQKNGFSLVEILVALTILAVIGVVAIPNFRKFNSDQDLTNATSNIIRLLQQSQTGSQSKVACVNSQPLNTNNPAISWNLVVSSANQYSLQADCINGSTGASVGTSIYETNNLSTNVTISAVRNPGGSPCAYPAVISFYTSSASNTTASPPPQAGQIVQLSCGGSNITPFSQVILSISQTGFPTRTVTVEANGTIHQ